ncbi:MAG: tetratricopeptide repeat protein [Kineosporiaceae bacterium]
MTQQPGPRLDVRGAVDLSALARPAGATARPAGATGGGPADPAASVGGGVVREVTDADFQEALELSLTVPVVVDLWAAWCGPCKQLSPVLEKLAAEYGGRFVLAKVDVDANPGLAQAFRAQSIPMVVTLLKGQAVPQLAFTGALPEQQVRQFVEQVLQVGAANGVSGRVGTDEEPAPAAEPALPPLHQKAYDAITRDDIDGAVEAYQQALAENPADAEARAGLANVQLLQRVRAIPQAVQEGARQAAATDPRAVEAHLAVADLDLFAGHVADAFARLVGLVRVTAGDDLARVRTRLLDFFEIVGNEDPRVVKARRDLANALF